MHPRSHDRFDAASAGRVCGRTSQQCFQEACIDPAGNAPQARSIGADRVAMIIEAQTCMASILATLAASTSFRTDCNKAQSPSQVICQQTVAPLPAHAEIEPKDFFSRRLKATTNTMKPPGGSLEKRSQDHQWAQLAIIWLPVAAQDVHVVPQTSATRRGQDEVTTLGSVSPRPGFRTCEDSVRASYSSSSCGLRAVAGLKLLHCKSCIPTLGPRKVRARGVASTSGHM